MKSHCDSKALTPIAYAFILLLSLLSLASAGADGPTESDGWPESHYGPCRAQIERYVTDRFQQTVTEIHFDFVFEYRTIGRGGDGPKSSAVVYTRECPGYHVFDLFASDYDCEFKAHYGEVPNYIHYRVSEEGC